MMSNGEIRSVIVLGGGSAGFIAALTLKAKHPNLSVTVIRSKEIGIIGVGEGTTPAVPTHLHGYIGLDSTEFYKKAQPTWKLGIRFLWGPRPHFDYTFGRQCDWKYHALPRNNAFYCNEEFQYADMLSALMSHNRVFMRQKSGFPLVRRVFGYHIENEKFVGVLESNAGKYGVEVMDDTVEEVMQDENGVTGLRMKSGATLKADLYVDCSGFRSVLLHQTLGEPYISFKSSLFCDRAIAGGWDRTDEPVKPYTTSETMDAGWCWQIEHLTRIIRGYVYSSDFISDADAEREIRAKNPKLGDLRVVKFPSGRYRDSWVKNVIAVGNASGFVEPLEATSLAIICSESRHLSETLKDCHYKVTPSMKKSYNIFANRAWDNIRQFLALHYKFNNRVDTAFWKACLEKTDLCDAAGITEYYQENGPSTHCRNTLLKTTDMFGMEGYLTMFTGMKVPHKFKYEPSTSELRVWNWIRARYRAKALAAMPIPQAYRAVTSPAWKWNPNFYGQKEPVQGIPKQPTYANTGDEPL